MVLYRKIIHPYTLDDADNRPKAIDGFQGIWIPEEDKPNLQEAIRNRYKRPDETKIQFHRRFRLRFDERYVPVEITVARNLPKGYTEDYVNINKERNNINE